MAISKDPIGFNAGDSNLYRYVGNQSTTYTDPTGQSGWGVAGKALAESMAKLGIKRSWYRIHHIVGRELFSDPRFMRWLSNLGVEQNCAKNLIALPSKAGKKVAARGSQKAISAGFKDAALHSGRHLGEYVDDVAKRLEDIMKKNNLPKGAKGRLSDAQAKQMIEALQDEFRQGLTDGTIVLQEVERQMLLKKGGVIVVGGGIIILGSADTIQAAESYLRYQDAVGQMHEGLAPFKCDQGHGLLSDKFLDLLNPIADLEFFLDVGFWLGHQFDGVDPELIDAANQSY